MDFNNIIGHEIIIRNLKNAMKNNNIAHAYLFSGPKSIGKSKTAMAFAKTLLCEKEETQPCNNCSSCIKFDSGNHPDLHLEKPIGDYFKKEQIENIQKDIKTFPYEGNRKVFILEDIDKMTKEAQNSFLKTLEEPPEYAVIIMTIVNNYSILPTIVSRSQVLRFSPIENTKIEKAIIDKHGKSEEEARFIASFSNGIMGKAISICNSEEFKKLRDDLISLINDTINGDKFKIFARSSFFEENKDNINDIMDMILVWFRDLLLMKELDSRKFIINKDKTNILWDQCQKISKEKIYDIIDVVKRTKANISSKVNFQLNIELMLFKIQEV